MPDRIRAARTTVSTKYNEPIRTFERSATQYRTSLYANLPVLAREQLGIEAKDQLDVEVYRDKVVIRRGSADE
jgi:hypothetical protein